MKLHKFVQPNVCKVSHDCCEVTSLRSRVLNQNIQCSFRISNEAHEFLMAPAVEISIPTASISSSPKPHTVYHISIRLPLRSFTVQKRYSDFVTLHQSLSSQTGSAPPVSLPQKSWFTRTTSNPALTEERRKGLETYLRTLNEIDDGRWRNTSAWRIFLNLPSSASSANSSTSAVGMLGSLTSPSGVGAPITDPVVWIDCHRNLKTQLHDARIHLQRRDQAQTAYEQHESSAAAKRCLIIAGGMITALDQGLKSFSEPHGTTRRLDKLGEGELRRRKDLIGTARKEKDGLEALATSLAAKNAGAAVPRISNGGAAATTQQNSALFGTTNGPQHNLGGRSGRILGAPLQETERTRELGNEGVLQLQKQEMELQDEGLRQMTKGVLRLKEMSIAINDELDSQRNLLDVLDEDVSRSVILESQRWLEFTNVRFRVGGKLQVANKRVNKIS